MGYIYPNKKQSSEMFLLNCDLIYLHTNLAAFRGNPFTVYYYNVMHSFQVSLAKVLLPTPPPPLRLIALKPC